MNNVAFEITIGNMGKQKDIKLVTTERRRNCLVSKRNDQTTAFSKNRDAFEKKKNRDAFELPCLFRNFNTGIKWNINLRLFV